MSIYPFPILSLFSVYTNAIVTSNTSTATADEGDEETHLSDSEVEAQKILFYHSITSETDTNNRRIRLMGTVMGMADFARMLIPGEGPLVKSVHSQNQRMIWIEPEKGYFVHATIELPRATKHVKESSSDSIQDRTSYLEDEPLFAALNSGYSSYRLKYGTFQGLLVREGKGALEKNLDLFWTTWLQRWSLQSVNRTGFESVVGGLSSYRIKQSARFQIDPLLSQFIVSNPSAIPIIFHHSDVLYLPSIAHISPSPSKTEEAPSRQPPPLTEQDLLSLVSQLSHNLPPSPLPLPSKKEYSINNKKSNKSHSSVASNSEKAKPDSKWNTYTLGMGSYLVPPSVSSLPTLPTMRSMASMASLPSLGMPSLPSLPSLSIPSMTIPGRKEGAVVAKSSLVEPSITKDAIVTTSTTTATSQSNKGDDISTNINSSDEAVTGDMIDSEALADAIDSGFEALDLNHVRGEEVMKAEVKNLEEALSFYCGEEEMIDTLMEVRLYKRGILTLALATLVIERSELLESKALRLLEAVESIIDSSPRIQSAMSYRSLIKTNTFSSSNNWPTRDDEWSGKSSKEGQEIEGTLFECYRGLESEPHILETFVRLSSRQWIFASRTQSSSEASLSDRTDVYAVLPSKIGKEGSFIDASEEIRKLLDSDGREGAD